MGCINKAVKSNLVMALSVHLMNHDLSDLESLILIQITPKERTHGVFPRLSTIALCVPFKPIRIEENLFIYQIAAFALVYL